jgi:hypothetical protein
MVNTIGAPQPALTKEKRSASSCPTVVTDVDPAMLRQFEVEHGIAVIARTRLSRCFDGG